MSQYTCSPWEKERDWLWGKRVPEILHYSPAPLQTRCFVCILKFTLISSENETSFASQCENSWFPYVHHCLMGGRIALAQHCAHWETCLVTASPCNQAEPRMVAYTVKGCRITDILDHICDPAQDGTYPQKDGEAPHHLLEELDNLWSLLGRCKGIGPIPSQEFCSFDAGETLKKPRKTHRETNCWSSCFVNCPGPWESERCLVLPIPTF